MDEIKQDSGKNEFEKIHTIFEPVRSNGKYTEVKVKLITGKTHQIRAQLAHAGFPILGDQKYGTQTSMERSEELGIKNVSLFAYALTFTHPKTGKQMEFQAKTQNLAISHLLTTMN